MLIGSFLNLRATYTWLQEQRPANLILVCSGTFDQAAYEDVLGAGTLCELLWPTYSAGAVSDSAEMARRLYVLEKDDLPAAMAWSRNGRRLLASLDLADDVAFCLQRDQFNLVAELQPDGFVRRRSEGNQGNQA